MTITERYPWNKAQKAIFFVLSKEVPKDTKLEQLHRRIHELAMKRGVLNRLELIIAAENELGAATVQDINRHISDYKRIAQHEGLLEVFDPEEFLDENPAEDVGIHFSREGGYTLLDENMKETHNFKTVDEATQYLREHKEEIVEKDKPLVIEGDGFTFKQDAPARDLGDMSLTEAMQKPNDKIKPRPYLKVNKDLVEEAQKTLENIELD